MKQLLTILSFFAICVLSVMAQEISKLNSIKKVYLGDFGQGDGADLVREKVRLLLVKSGRFNVVEIKKAADAILTGTAGVEKKYHSSISGTPSGRFSGSGGTAYHGYGVLRLVDIKSQEAIWFFEYKRGFGFGSRSSRVADQIVSKLMEAAQEAERMQQPK